MTTVTVSLNEADARNLDGAVRRKPEEADRFARIVHHEPVQPDAPSRMPRVSRGGDIVEAIDDKGDTRIVLKLVVVAWFGIRFLERSHVAQ